MTQKDKQLNKTAEGWEERFDEKFGSVHQDKPMPSGLKTAGEIKQFIREEQEKIVKAELEFLERLKLEVDTVICDCGEPYKDSDLADLINKRLEDIKALITKRL